MEALIDAMALIAIVFGSLVVLFFDNEGGRKEETEEEKEKMSGPPDKICFDAFRGLTEDEFSKLPSELRQKVPDKCSFCRWVIECDPLEMALTTGLFCSGFEERRWKR
jgi:hypothetical protein